MRCVRALSLVVTLSVASLCTPLVLAAEDILAPLTPEEEAIVEKLRTPPSMPEVADENNAAVIYRSLFALLGKNSVYDRKAAEVVNGACSALESGVPEPLPPEPEASEKETGGLRQIYEIEGRQYDMGVDWSQGPHTELSHFARMRTIARMLTFQALFDHEQGRPERALRHVELILKMSEDLSHEPVLISQSVATALAAYARYTLTRMALARSDDRELLEAISTMLKSRPAYAYSAMDAFDRERRTVASYWVRLALDEEMTADGFALEVGRWTVLLQEERDAGAEENMSAAEEKRKLSISKNYIELALGIGSGGYSEDTFRECGKRIALIYWRECEKTAEAAERGPEALLKVQAEIDAVYSGEIMVPQRAAFAGWVYSYPRWFLRVQEKYRRVVQGATVEVLNSLLEGRREIAGFLDPFGRPYEVHWFSDTVYFESPSEYKEPHDLDFWFGKSMEWDNLQKRLKEREEAIPAPEGGS